MRSLVTTLILAASVLVAVPPAASAPSLLFDYVGFDYEDPKPGSDFGDVGNGYVSLGTVPFLFAPLTSNTTLNEYTYVIDGMQSTSITLVGPYRIVTYSVGTLTIYEDAKLGGTAADFGTSPPNGVAPSTFTDGGNAILVASVTNFKFVVDNSNGTGSFEADVTVTGGSQLANFPLDQRTGWTFAGSTGNALNIPEGYEHQIDGQTFLNGPPTNVRRTTWGRLKAGYR